MDTALKLLCTTFITSALLLGSFSAPVKRDCPPFSDADLKDQVITGLLVMEEAIWDLTSAVSDKNTCILSVSIL